MTSRDTQIAKPTQTSKADAHHRMQKSPKIQLSAEQAILKIKLMKEFDGKIALVTAEDQESAALQRWPLLAKERRLLSLIVTCSEVRK